MELFSIWIESLGTKQYFLPEDREKRLFDFYLLNLLVNDVNNRQNFSDRDELLKYDVNQSWEILLKSLKQELLDEVFYSIVSEMRHVHTFMTYKSAQKFKDDPLFNELMDYAFSGIKKSKLPELVEKFKDRKPQFVKMAQKVFAEGDWETAYGGNAWAKICESWLKLYNSNSINGISVWIDHIYDLQHNTDTVFNKLPQYDKNGYGWIKNSLDFKRHAKSAKDLIPYASPIVQKLANEVTIKEIKQVPSELALSPNEKVKRLSGHNLDFILNQRPPWFASLINFNDSFFDPQNIFSINQSALDDYARKNNLDISAKDAKIFFDRNLFKSGIRFSRCSDSKNLCFVLPLSMSLNNIFNTQINEKDFIRETADE